MNHQRFAFNCCGGFLFAALLTIPIHGADPACRTMLEAGKKFVATASHTYLTRVAGFKGNRPETMESITVDGVFYVLVNGKWTRTNTTPQEKITQAEEMAEKQTCQHVRDESVNGEAAAVYTSHTKSEYGNNDTTIWISKSRGLPLREEIDTDVGTGAVGKSHMSGRFEYTNVHPPAGVR